MTDTLSFADVVPLVERVDPEGGALLRANPGPITYTPLPFYAGAGLVRAEARLPTHPVLLQYVLERGPRRLLPLGSAERVLAANGALGLRLTPATVVEYLRFYLQAAGGDRPAREIVERPDDLRWMPDAMMDAEERAARDSVVARVHPARVEAGGARVTASTVRGYALEAVTFRVEADGRVTEERVTRLVDAAPLAAAF